MAIMEKARLHRTDRSQGAHAEGKSLSNQLREYAAELRAAFDNPRWIEKQFQRVLAQLRKRRQHRPSQARPDPDAHAELVVIPGPVCTLPARA